MTIGSTTEIPTHSTESQEPATDFVTAALPRPYLEPVVLISLIVLMLAQLWTSVVQLSITSDEIDHLHAAYRYWQCNDFGWNPEHPPLVKIVAALPLQAMRVNDPIPHACGMADDKSIDFIAGHAFVFANPERMLTAARFSVSIFAVLLLLTVWFFARKMFGLPVAIISGVLIAFDPNILSHGALVTTDIAASLGFLLAVYALFCYVTQPNRTRLLVLGLATGFALCLKYSTILLAVILPVLLLSDAVLSGRSGLSRKLLRNTGVLCTIGATAFIVLWACYGFHYSARPGGTPTWISARLPLAHGPVATKVIPRLEASHILPQAYLVGLQDVLVESELGRPSFLLGKLHRKGTWIYFPVAATIKFTLPVLILVAVSAFSIGFWKSRLRQLIFLVVPVLLFLGFSMTSKLSIGVRHLLPVLPLLTIFGAASIWNLAQRRRWALIALIMLLAFHAASSLHAYPNYLSYGNELWGGPGETYRYLANSDVDWGQAQKMARTYVERTRPANCFFLRTYNNKNSDYNIPCGGISELQWDQLDTPYTGTMIVSSSMVDGIGVRGASVQTYRTFRDLKPNAKIGGSALLVYDGTFDVGPLVAAQLLLKARETGDDNPRAALELAQRASALDPKSGDAHIVICGAYHALGNLAQAQQECDTGLALVRQDPQYGPDHVKFLQDFILRNGLMVEGASRD